MALRLLPQLGHLPADGVKRAHLAQWAGWAEAQEARHGERYAHDTVLGWWRVLLALVRDMAADYGCEDPARRVRPPEGDRRAVREGQALVADDLARLLAAVDARWPRWSAEVRVCAFTGMRAGELYGLQWGDMDTAGGALHIRRSVRRGVVAPTKTRAPRVAALTPALEAVLSAHRAAQEAAGLPTGPADWIFPSSAGGPRESASLLPVLYGASEAAGLDKRAGPQMLRRTFNTLAVLTGADRLVLRAQMGHTSERMTERYAGIPTEAKRCAVEGVEGAVKGGQKVGGGGSE